MARFEAASCLFVRDTSHCSRANAHETLDHLSASAFEIAIASPSSSWREKSRQSNFPDMTAPLLLGPITTWDHIVLQWLHSNTTAFGIRFMATFTTLGAWTFLAIPGIGIGALLVH